MFIIIIFVTIWFVFIRLGLLITLLRFFALIMHLLIFTLIIFILIIFWIWNIFKIWFFGYFVLSIKFLIPLLVFFFVLFSFNFIFVQLGKVIVSSPWHFECQLWKLFIFLEINIISHSPFWFKHLLCQLSDKIQIEIQLMLFLLFSKQTELWYVPSERFIWF